MPYINPEIRKLMAGGGTSPATPGELNYAITVLINEYFDEKWFDYGKLAEVTGVLENVKQELYRRIAAPYEDIKLAENGEVYSDALLNISGQAR